MAWMRDVMWLLDRLMAEEEATVRTEACSSFMYTLTSV